MGAAPQLPVTVRELVETRTACSWGNAWPADAVKTVAPGDEITGQLAAVSIFQVSDLRAGAIEVLHADVFNLKNDLTTGRDSGIVQVFQNLVLRVDRDSFSTGEILKIDAVTAASEAQLDPMVDQAFGFHPLAYAQLRE
jgi:hypothetical protein